MFEVKSSAFEQRRHGFQLGQVRDGDHVLHGVQVVSDAIGSDVPLSDGLASETAEHGGLPEQVLLLREGHLAVSIHVQDREDGRSLPAFLLPWRTQALLHEGLRLIVSFISLAHPPVFLL